MAAGKGFARQLLTGDEAYCGTIGKDYAKCRSTEPFLIHPVDSSLSRLFTPSEHAALKGIPVGVINGNSDVVSHKILGQSVIYPLFEAVFYAFGKKLQVAGDISDFGSVAIPTRSLGVDAHSPLPEQVTRVAAHPDLFELVA